MTGQQYRPEDFQKFRDRIVYEDQMLNQRTGIVLTINGLVAIANVIDLNNDTPILLPIAIFIINVFWLLCAIEAWRFIARLSQILRNDQENVPVDVREHIAFTKNWLRFKLGQCSLSLRLGPTKTLGLIVPLVLSLAWGTVVYWKLWCS